MTRKCISLLLTVLLLGLVGCSASNAQDADTGPQPMDFSKSGLTITLTDDFSEKEYVTYTACYESADIAVFALKEEFWLFDSSVLSAESTAAEYAGLLWKSNGFSNELAVTEQDGLTWFQYDRDLNGREYTYRVYVFKGSDAFWMVQFAAFANNFANVESTIHGYAKTVVME